VEGQDLYDLARLDTLVGICTSDTAYPPSSWLDATRTKLVTEIRPPIYVCPSDQSEPKIKDATWWAFPNGASQTTGSYAGCQGTLGPASGAETTQTVKCGNTGMLGSCFGRKLKQLTDGTS